LVAQSGEKMTSAATGGTLELFRSAKELLKKLDAKTRRAGAALQGVAARQLMRIAARRSFERRSFGALGAGHDCCTLRGGTGDFTMILSHLAAATLVVAVATGPLVEPSVGSLSLQQRGAATRVFVRSATDCIARKVAADDRFSRDDPSTNLGELIVDAVPKCLSSVRALIDAHDRYFGEGSGEAFFMGTYLDALPTAVMKAIRTGGEETGPTRVRDVKDAK
jgi:hypothetical protein